jgi:hypothetical protein
MHVVKTDGGREAAGYVGRAGDCVCRAIVLATGRPYQEVYERLADGNAGQRKTKRCRKAGRRSARDGIYVGAKWFKAYMQELGFHWVPTMQIGSGCKVHLRDGELPSGRLVVSLSRHYTCVIDGVIHDLYDPQRETGRCVYGYWTLANG